MTQEPHAKPAYRADQVGSLLRPQALIDAHLAYADGRLANEDLRELEDEAILAALRMQAQAGLDVLSDGEFRRSGWTGDIAAAIEGFVPAAAPVKVEWHRDATSAGAAPPAGGNSARQTKVIGGRLQARARLAGGQAPFLAAHSPLPYKVTLPAASYILSRGFMPGVTDKVYGSRKEALAAVAAIVRAEVVALIAEGVPYIQLDNPHYPDYLMSEINDQWRALGVDPDQALAEDVEADNASFADLPLADTVIGMHFCRGNGGQGAWHSRGGYDPIAEQTFGELKVDRLLLEYDSDRAGGFEPLRHVRKTTVVVLGLVSTKTGVLESKDLLRRRIDEAAKYVPVERLALSPQCGFASQLRGNPMSRDDQKRKLELVSETARAVWGQP